MTDLRQSEEYGKYMEKLGWRVFPTINQLTNQQINIFVRPLGILGAIAKIQRAGYPLPWDGVDRVLRENKVWMCKLEPLVQATVNNSQLTINELRQHGFKQDKWPLSVSKTICLSLSTSLREIRNNFKKDARYCLRQAEEKIKNKTLKIEKNKFEEFYECWKKGAKLKKLWIPKKELFMTMVEIFGDDCFCLTASNEEGVIAGVFVLITDKTAYNYYSTSLPEGKKLNAPYLLVWEAMKEAKKRGCSKWDFEGIYDQRWPNNGWLGFSHFKKSFGGEEIEYIGSFTKWRLQL